MTSGKFDSVLIDSIVVNREERNRRKLEKITELALSIRNRGGLIHPIVINREYLLAAGERRLEACKSLGWTHIPVQWLDTLSERERRAIELEENIKRCNLEYDDECRAMDEWHESAVRDDPSWTHEQTAAVLGLERPTVTEHLLVAEAIKSGVIDPEEVKTFSTAKGILMRERERNRAASDELLRSVLSDDEPEPRREAILQENFIEWAPRYEGPRFNFLHVDFPYGIGADAFNQGSAPAHGGYDDTPETYRALLNCLLNNLDRICAASAHIVFWFSMENYGETLELLRTRFVVPSHPLIWLKSDNAGILPDPSRGPRRIYETAFFGYRGDRKVVRAVSNAYAAPSVRDSHMSEKSEPMLRYFFGMIVDQHTTMLDPTCGSGSALRAAESLDASRVLGLEIDPTFVDRARLKLRQARNLRELSA